MQQDKFSDDSPCFHQICMSDTGLWYIDGDWDERQLVLKVRDLHRSGFYTPGAVLDLVCIEKAVYIKPEYVREKCLELIRVRQREIFKKNCSLHPVDNLSNFNKFCKEATKNLKRVFREPDVSNEVKMIMQHIDQRFEDLIRRLGIDKK